jgi:hypothetical protein
VGNFRGTVLLKVLGCVTMSGVHVCQFYSFFFLGKGYLCGIFWDRHGGFWFAEIWRFDGLVGGERSEGGGLLALGRLGPSGSEGKGTSSK